MTPLNAFADAKLELAIWRLERLAELLDGNIVTRTARDMVLQTRGDLVAMRQLIELQGTLEKADTERPAHLRVVK